MGNKTAITRGSEVAGRPTGRPPKTSREAILICAIELLQHDSSANVSLGRIAKELNIVTMAIYNYFDSRDVLMQAVVDRLLTEFTRPNMASGPWQRKIAAWASTMRANFLCRPYLIHLLHWEGQTSIEWVRQTLLISDVLEEAGLCGEALARSTLWVSRNIMSDIYVELSAADISQPSKADAEQLSIQWQERLSALSGFMQQENYHEASFNHSIQRVLDALALEINRANLERHTADVVTESAPRPVARPIRTYD